MKKIISLCIGAGLLASMSFASEIGIFFNGEKLVSDVPPVAINDRVMLPIRVISEKAGATVDFNYNTKEVTLTNNHAIVKLKLNSNIGYINNQQKVLDVPATDINNRTLVPVRFVGEALGLDIQWDNQTDSVKIYGTNNTVSKDNVNVNNNASRNMIGSFKKVGSFLQTEYYPESLEEPFSEGLMCVEKDNKYGYIDKTGKEVIPCIYEEAFNFSEGVAVVRRTGEHKYEYIDKTGKVVIPFKFNSAESFSEGLALVYDNSNMKYGYIDKTGKVVVPCIYFYGQNYKEGTALVDSDKGTKVIDKKGNEIDKNSIRDTYWFKNVMFVDEKNGMYGYRNILGEEIVPYIYEMASTTLDGVATVMKDGKAGAIDSTGKVVVPFDYDRVQYLPGGLIAVVKDGKCGLVDENGKEVIQCIYTDVRPLVEGLVAVQKDYLWGYVDEQGREVLPCKYEYVSNFVEGLAIVIEENEDYTYTINIVEK